jgi:hypothetical protein
MGYDAPTFYKFNGTIDEVAIYNKALTEAEVYDLYNSNKAKFIDYSNDSVSGSALVFDGVDDYVLIPDSNSLDINDTITIIAWIKTNALTRQSIITKTVGGDSGPQNYHFGVMEGVLYLENYDEGWTTFSGKNNVADGDVHQVVGIFKHAIWYKLYVDGIWTLFQLFQKYNNR